MSSLAGTHSASLSLFTYLPSGSSSLAFGSCGRCGIFGLQSSASLEYIVMLRTKMLGASRGIDPSMNKEAILDCVQTILDSFCAGRKTILDSASVHTQER